MNQKKKILSIEKKVGESKEETRKKNQKELPRLGGRKEKTIPFVEETPCPAGKPER